jgi:competence protein ComEC
MRTPAPPQPVLVGIVALALVALAQSGEIRARASDALGVGMPAREAALARGFVLGEDEGIDPATKESFRRSGLSHLLAVSGENVTLLGLLAIPVLALFGVPLRERLVWVLALIAVYVPVAGAGPSIQRAAVMGAIGLIATLAGRRASILFAIGVACAVTLAVDPGVARDPGWQLSFAAVLGIVLIGRPLAAALVVRLGPGAARRTLADGLAVTIAATLATAPLIAYRFGVVSTTTLLANILALPAVAPAMWLGMASAALAQLPGAPLEPVNLIDGLLLSYVAQVAGWCGRPRWAQLDVAIGARGLAASYLLLAVGAVGLARSAWVRRIFVPAALVAGLCSLLAIAALGGSLPEGRRSSPGLRVEVLDVGQGDAILLVPREAQAVLVDGGPPGDGLDRLLGEAGIDKLGAALITHDQSDHAGGIMEILGEVPIERLLYGRLRRSTLKAAMAAGVDPQQIARGREVRSGQLRLEVLWPPAELLSSDVHGVDPNQLAVVVLARWHSFNMLLTADAEAEAVPVDPGPVDVLKVAHHGSDDAGLGSLLEEIRPRLAVVSVGSDNPYGHPTAGTLETLERHGVAVDRTDRDGTVVIEVKAGAMEVHTEA